MAFWRWFSELPFRWDMYPFPGGYPFRFPSNKPGCQRPRLRALSMATLGIRHVLRCPKDVQLMMRRKVPRRLKDAWWTWRQVVIDTSHMLHVGDIYLRFPFECGHFSTLCRWIIHTWNIWVWYENLSKIWHHHVRSPNCFPQQFAMKDGVAVATGYTKIAERSIDE